MLWHQEAEIFTWDLQVNYIMKYYSSSEQKLFLENHYNLIFHLLSKPQFPYIKLLCIPTTKLIKY